MLTSVDASKTSGKSDIAYKQQLSVSWNKLPAHIVKSKTMFQLNSRLIWTKHGKKDRKDSSNQTGLKRTLDLRTWHSDFFLINLIVDPFGNFRNACEGEFINYIKNNAFPNPILNVWKWEKRSQVWEKPGIWNIRWFKFDVKAL